MNRLGQTPLRLERILYPQPGISEIVCSSTATFDLTVALTPLPTTSAEEVLLRGHT